MSYHNKKHVMHKMDKVSSSLKMKNITGSAKNYEHSQDKAERLCRGGYAKGGHVLDPGGPTETKSEGFYGGDNMKINIVKGDE